MVLPTIAAAIGARAMPTIFTNGAPSASPLKICILEGEAARDRERRQVASLVRERLAY